VEISYQGFDEGGPDGAGLRGTIRDIGAEVAAHGRLAELQEQYRLAFENGPLGRLVLDVSTSPPRFLQVNQALADLLGYSQDEMCALDPLTFLHPDDVQVEEEALLRCLRGEDASVSYGARRRHKDGRWIPVWLTGALQRDDQGEPRYAMATIQDRRPQLEAEAEAQRAWNETLRRIATAVEYRDEETGAHVERMSAYCELLALHLGFGGERAAMLRVAAQLHDAGKIAIPDHILLKPGRLTPEERKVVESHTEVGYRLLRGTGSPVLDLAASVAWTHHERFDGSGYPRQLAGERIPLEGRIATVADVFDALTSDRVYRQAMSLDDAIAILRAGRGTQFDPAVLDVFLEHLDEALELADRYRDPAGEVVPFQPPHTRYTLRAVEGSA
jgi:PAS domain S-box-containing protein